jgi:uncharacterized protein YciI
VERVSLPCEGPRSTERRSKMRGGEVAGEHGRMAGIMAKQHYFARLIPPRPTFPFDMTADERAVMMEHVKYTHEKFAAGKVLIFGPVMAREGAFGMAVFEVADEAELREITENDPSVLAGLNKFEWHPMKLGAAQGSPPE